MGRYRSGQTGWTVNSLAYAFKGSNPFLPTICRYSVSVNTQGFHPCKEGSTPSSDAN